MVYKFVGSEQMHLEKYSILSPSTKRELEYQLAQAQERKDTKEQALIHSGIYSIEAAITAYVKKYAKTKKVKDLVESFREVLESNQILFNAKKEVAENEEAAKALTERANAIMARIESGEDARLFEKDIETFDPMKKIEKKAEELGDTVIAKAGRVFQSYGATITSKSEAKSLVKGFSNRASDAIAEMSAELDSVINKELIETGEHLLQKYQEKLTKFDDEAGEQNLDFNTVDLIKGALQNIRENAESWGVDDIATSMIDEAGTVSYENRTYHVKVGEEEEEVIVGSHEEKVGTRQIRVGSHQEYRGTRKVKNKSKSWWQVWKDSYVEEDVYETVDDYESEDVYKTVLDYKTVIRDVFEERTEKIEKFSVAVSTLQKGLVSDLQTKLDAGIRDAEDFAHTEIKNVKAQFVDLFHNLDAQISQKYGELEACANDQKTKEEELEKNKKLLAWIENCQAQMESMLDI